MSKQALVLLALAAIVHTGPSLGQAWPIKPVLVVVPYAAGGSGDVQTRVVTTRMSADLGQPIVIENKPGANANIGAETVAKAPADGYTLLASSPFIINNPLIEPDLRWQPRDFVPVSRFALSPSFFVVPANSPANSVKEYVAMAKAKPGLPYGDPGAGSSQSMAIQMFKIVAGISLEQLSYKGSPAVVPDLINGLVTMAIFPSTVAIPHIKSGKLKVLANTSDKRSRLLPDVPTIAEAGFPEMTVLSWQGLHAPAGTPREVVRKISAAVRAATSNQEVQERTANTGGETAFLATVEFEEFLRLDAARWQKISQALKK